MSDLIELKPCPFCGGEAQTYETQQDDGEYCVQTQCRGCGAEVAFWLPWTSGYGQRIAAWNDTEKRWNTRALIDTPTPSAPSPEAVARAALEHCALRIEVLADEDETGDYSFDAGWEAAVKEAADIARFLAAHPDTIAAIAAKAGGEG